MESFTTNPKCLNLPWLWWHWGTHCCPLHGEWWGRTDPCSDRPWAPHWTCKVKPWELPGRTGTHSWNFPVGSQCTSQSKPGWTGAQGKDYCRRAPEMHKMRTRVIKKDLWKNREHRTCGTKQTSELGSENAPVSGHFCSKESKMMFSSCLS